MAKTDQTTATKEDALKLKNEALRTVYFKILNEIKNALPQYPTEYLRTYLEVDYSPLGMKCQHAFFNPLIHLQLEETDNGLVITFSRNMAIKHQVGNHLDGLFNRIIYKNTDAANTPVFIEDAVSMDAYNVDDFRHAHSLALKGYKEAKKVTV